MVKTRRTEMIRHLTNSGIPQEQAEQMARAESPTVATNTTLWALDKLLSIHAHEVHKQHRLRFVHVEDDGSFTFVCICGDGFSQRENWNDHICNVYGTLEEGDHR